MKLVPSHTHKRRNAKFLYDFFVAVPNERIQIRESRMERRLRLNQIISRLKTKYLKPNYLIITSHRKQGENMFFFGCGTTLVFFATKSRLNFLVPHVNKEK